MTMYIVTQIILFKMVKGFNSYRSFLYSMNMLFDELVDHAESNKYYVHYVTVVKRLIYYLNKDGGFDEKCNMNGLAESTEL